VIIADAGPLVAILNAEDRHHAACADVLGRYRGPITVPAPIITEVAFLVQRDAGSEAEAQFLESLVRRELIVEDLAIADYQRMAALVRQYSGFPLGSADASVIAVAERLGATRIATIDLRHFRAVKPAHCSAFQLFPADANDKTEDRR
jgi:predicted nucleic acid-binding protein